VFEEKYFRMLGIMKIQRNLIMAILFFGGGMGIFYIHYHETFLEENVMFFVTLLGFVSLLVYYGLLQALTGQHVTKEKDV
jgi:hypothetical protein